MTDRGLALAIKIKALVEGTQNVEQLADEVRKLVGQARAEGVPDITEDMRRGADETVLSVNKLGGALKLLAGAEVVRRFIDVNASMESLEAALTAVTGSGDAAAAELDFIRAEADRLGLGVGEAAQSFLTLAAATKGTNLEGQATRDIWSGVAGAMARLGASSADVQGAMIQLAQGASKGKFELEDLKSIAERIPGFFGKFAASLGVTNERFFEMVGAGQITTNMLPALARALSDGSGAIDTFNANASRLRNSLTELATSEAGKSFFEIISALTLKAAQGLGLLAQSLKVVGSLWQDDAAQRKALEGYQKILREFTGINSEARQAGAAGKQAGADIAAGMAQAVPATEQAREAIKDLAAAYKTLGVDPDEIRTGMDAASRTVLAAFRRIAADPSVGGDALLAGFLSALDKASGEAIPALAFELKSLARDRPFETTRIDADQLAAGLEAVKAKTAGLWPELKKADNAAASLVRTYQGLIAEANRLRAGVKAPVDDSIEGQASATFDLANAQEKLLRLQGTGAGLEAIRQQADLVRSLSTRLTDQQRAQEGVNQAALLEAAALEREAGAIKQVAEAAGQGAEFKVKADTSEARAQMQAFIDEMNRAGGLQLKVNLVDANGAALPAAISQAALARGARR